MDTFITALLTAAAVLIGCALGVRLCLRELARRPPLPMPQPPSTWGGLNLKDWPNDRELHLVHSEQFVEGTGRHQRQVTRVTHCNLKPRETTPLEPVQWLPADAAHQQQRDRLQRAYEVHDVTARWKTTGSPGTTTLKPDAPALSAAQSRRVHWLA